MQIQPCYWRDNKQLTKRAARDVDNQRLNTTLSENLSLFQSIQVVTDDELSRDTFVKESVVDQDQLCLKPVAVGAVIGNH